MKFTKFKAIWRTKELDIPITVIGLMGEKDGVKYYKIKEGKTGISEKEIIVHKKYKKFLEELK